jgi:hypothetical protein
MRCSGLQRVERAENTFRCPVCKSESRIINGEDMFDRTAPNKDTSHD